LHQLFPLPARLLFLVILPIVLGAAGVRFTLRKLDKMEQLRGFKPAEDPRVITVLEKRLEPKSCWIRWADGAPIDMPGGHRMWMTPASCSRHEVGDQIDVLFFPEDAEPYAIEDSVFASDGNFAFDRQLLGMESAVMIIVPLSELLILFFKRRR
jgi:hypothetical protein